MMRQCKSEERASSPLRQSVTVRVPNKEVFARPHTSRAPLQMRLVNPKSHHTHSVQVNYILV